MDVLSTVLFRMGTFRDVWLHSPDGFTSYFRINVAIAVCFGVLASLAVAKSLRRPRKWGDLALAVAVLLFVGGFGFRLAFIGTHHLDDRWYADARSGEPFDRVRVYLGLVLDRTAASARVQLESCEELTLSLPAEPTTSRIVVVEESHGRYSGERRFSATQFVEYDDLCNFLFTYTGARADGGCLTRRCS